MSNVGAVSDWPTPISYKCLILTYSVYGTVFELLAFLCISFIDRKLRQSDFFAWWHRRLKISADSERPTTISYNWLIVTFTLCGIVFELLAFVYIVYGPEMTSTSPLGGVACQMFGWILNGLPRFPISV